MSFRLALVILSCIAAPLTADVLEPFRKVFEKQSKLRTVSVAVQQTKRIPALTEPVVESGHLWMVPGKSFRWELGTPRTQSAVFDGGEVFLIDESRKTGMALPPDDRRAKPLMLMLGFGEGATFEGLQEAFTIAGTNTVNEHFIVSLVPKGRLKRALTGMVMQVNTRTSFLELIEWNQKDGTVVVVEFFPPVIDKPIPASTFVVKKDGYTWE
jgi:outer membrane lipoprotein-sorting protein